MEVNYLTLGRDCSPAAALKYLHLRKYALPFDWVSSNINSLERCFVSNFDKFHKDLVFNHNKTRFIDYYNFEFPHDYPLNDNSGFEYFKEEDTYISEQDGKHITDKWIDHYDSVLEKYNRRIQRFKDIINDTKPIICLTRYNTGDVLKLQKIFNEYYKIEDIYFVNSSSEIFETDKIINVHTEKNGEWNDISIWKKGIDDAILKITSKK